MLCFNKLPNMTSATVTDLPFRLISYASLSDYSPCRQLSVISYLISQELIQQIVSDSERDNLFSLLQVYQSKKSFVYKVHNGCKINLLHLNYKIYLNKEIM